MFEFIGIILQYLALIFGMAALSFLFLSVSINISHHTNTPFRVFLRIICFLIFIALGIFLISSIDFDASYIVGLISYIVGAIFTFYMKKGVREEKRRKQQEQEREENN